MPFEKPPALDDYDEIMPGFMPEKSIKGAQNRKRNFRVLIILCGLVVVILGLADLSRNNITAPLGATGSLRGTVINSRGMPFDGYVSVEKTTLETKTKIDGTFELNNIPVGRQLIVVADKITGNEFAVEITAGQTTEMGKIKFEATATP